jgi:effector-binding domain-containing protein
MISEPKLEYRLEKSYVAIRTQVPIPFGKYLGPLWNEVDSWLGKRGINQFGPAIIRYLTTDMSKKLDIEVGFVTDQAVAGDGRILADVLPAGKYATLVYTGPYKGKGIYKATVAILDWAKENRIVWDTSFKENVEWWAGRVELYLSDPAKEADTHKYRTELAFLTAGA